MTTQADLKRIRALQQKKGRDEQGLFLVQGPKLVAELQRSHWPVEAIYATAHAAEEHGIPEATVLPDHELERLGTLESGNVLVAVVRQASDAPLHVPVRNELVLALDGITDPGNLGTVLRIADWFGIDRVICTPRSVERFNPKCVQATMGALFRVQVAYAELPSLLAEWQAAGTVLYLASMEGSDVFTTDLHRPAVLVLGSESHGISDEVRSLDATLIGIPRLGAGESLNVASAASALCMEFARQARTP
jgi:RNA methyltransferase, TrmH family